MRNRAMLSDILRERFEWAEYWHLEGKDDRELTDEESATVHRLEKLGETVFAIPPPLLEHAECLAKANEERFGDTLDRMIARVGRGYYPDTAEEFVQALSKFLER
jgi:hypothetical protein